MYHWEKKYFLLNYCISNCTNHSTPNLILDTEFSNQNGIPVKSVVQAMNKKSDIPLSSALPPLAPHI